MKHPVIEVAHRSTTETIEEAIDKARDQVELLMLAMQASGLPKDTRAAFAGTLAAVSETLWDLLKALGEEE